MNLRNLVILIALCALPIAFGGSTTQPASTKPASPVHYRHIARTSPPMHIHVITVDLADPRVRVRVCRDPDDPDGPDGPWQTRLRTVRETAKQSGLYCAVNGNFFAGKEARKFAGRTLPYFSGNPARLWGWAMTDGKLWSTDEGARFAMIVNREGRITIDQLPPGTSIPADAYQIVGGSELLVVDGKVTTKNTDRAPRTAVGIDRDARTLFLVVVDGRDTSHSIGMYSHELAAELIALGCDRALMLDGGGSSTMVLMDEIEREVRVVNQPSDGHDLPIKLSLERPVGNVVGVEVREQVSR